MTGKESEKVQALVAYWGEALLERMIGKPVEFTMSDGRTIIVPSGALSNPSGYPSSIRVTVDGVEYEIFDDVMVYVKAKLPVIERQP